MNKHLLILGDSVFDNTLYLKPDELDGQAWLKKAIPNYHQTFLAVDGATTHHVIKHQIKYIKDAVKANGEITDLIISIGGNNLLGDTSLLGVKTPTVMDGMSLFRSRQATFAREYGEMWDAIKSTLDDADCYPNHYVLGVYYACFKAEQDNPTRRFPTDKKFQKASRLAVDCFNMEIIKSLMANDIELSNYIDLNVLFSYGRNAEYYANPIEPSSYGSETIANELQYLISKS